MPKIFIFGDSLPYGKWDSEIGGWANRLRVWLDEKVLSGKGYFETFNFGVPGDSSAGLLARFESDLLPRWKESEDAIIIFQIGINDTQFVSKEGALRTTKADFGSNISNLIGIAQKYTKKVIFIGITPVNEEQTLTVPWYHDDYYKNATICEYSGIIEQVCNKKGAKFIDLFEKFHDEKAYFENLEDGLHPNDKGHAWIFRVVRDFLVGKNLLG
ncbi:MAG: GDSL-type esterase/lipase family protein [Candidatus Aenigmatarchaeota archaeon]